MRLKAAIVGCGKIADGHVEEIGKLGGLAEVVAVCDRELVMAKQLAVRYGSPATYDDFGKMLEIERPDVVHVTTPPQAHLELARRAVEAGAHVFVEKPLTLTYEDSKKLVDLVTAAKKKLGIGYSYYFEAPAETLREHVRRGELGEIVHLESFYGYNLDGAFGQALLGDPTHWVHAMPGKLLQNTLDHALAKIVEYLPDERPEVLALGSARRAARFGDVRDELADEARITIRGAKTTAYVTFSAHARPMGHFLRVYGTKGSAHLDFNHRTCTLEVAHTLPSALGRLVPAFQVASSYMREGARNMTAFAHSDFHYFAGLGRYLRRFYQAIADDQPEPIAPRDILRVAWLMDEIFAGVRRTMTAQREEAAS
ncbi:MAG: Gfo/Idh/MocA family oxidoreductase [Polyangiaceae bacterium]